MNGVKLKTGVELTFEYLTNKNEGVYECQAHNQYGSARRETEINLESAAIYASSWSLSSSTMSTTSSTSTTTTASVVATAQSQPHQHHHINIQVLSNPQVDHVENGRVKIKCISDIADAVYVWSMVNGTAFSHDVHVDGDTLTLEPFTRDSAGVYRCLAYNIERNEQASRRININIESSAAVDAAAATSQSANVDSTKYIFVDITHKMRIEMISSPNEMKRGGTVRLKCSVGKHSFTI